MSDSLHHDSAHRVSRGAQTDIMSHGSAIRIKVSSGRVGCKSLSFYVEPLNMGIFSSLLWNFASCVPVFLIEGYPTQSTTLFPTILHSPNCCQGTLYESLYHHTLPQYLPNSLPGQAAQWNPNSKLQMPDHRARGPSQSILYSLPSHAFFPFTIYFTHI